MGYATHAAEKVINYLPNKVEGLVGGLFGSSPQQDNSAEDQANALENQQIQQNQAELAQKEAALYRQRIGIIRANGAPDFTGNNQNAPVIGKPAIGTPPMAPNAK